MGDNYSGYIGEDHVPVPLSNEKNLSPNAPEVAEARHNTINTFYVTAPFEGFDNIALRRYLVGPDYYQVRVIPEFTVTDELYIEVHLKKVARLSTEVNIEKFIEVLGKPLIVNVSPTFDIRTDLTQNQRYDLEHPPEPSLTSKICGLVSYRTLFSKVSLVCAQLKLKSLFGEDI